MKDPIPRQLYKLLVCPTCKIKLIYNKDKTGLTCDKCKHVYPIKEGIPILLPRQNK